MSPRGLILAHTDRAERSPLDRNHLRQLLPVGNKPILCHTLESMAAAGIADVAIAVTAEGEAAVSEAVGSGERWGVSVSYLRADGIDGLLALLLASEAFLDGHAFVLQDGDGLLRHNLAPLLRAVGEAEDEPADALLLVHRGGGLREVTADRADAAAFLALAGGFTLAPGLAVAGAHVFGAAFISRAREEMRRHRGEADLSCLAEGLLRRGTRVAVQRVEGWRCYSGRPRELLEMNRLVLDGLAAEPAAERPHLDRTQIEGRVAVHPSARISSSVIRGPTVIGAGATIIDAFVGPYTSIGDRARIEGSEIEHSIVLPGAAVLHVGARLESSVVGRDARVVRDFSVPQTLRLQLGDDAYVRLR